VKPVADGTAVTLTYDWTGARQKTSGRFGVPLADTDGLGWSLQLLARNRAFGDPVRIPASALRRMGGRAKRVSRNSISQADRES
jgi:hypothetical protein